MKALGIILIAVGSFLELSDVFSVVTGTFDTTRGASYLMGQVFFNVVLALTGVVLIIIGVKMTRSKQ